MAIPSDRIKTHNIWGTLSKLVTTLEQIDSLDKLGPDDVANVSRAHTITTHVHQRLTALDPDLTPPGPLNEINRSLTQAEAELRSYLSSKNSVYLSNTVGQFDAALVSMASLQPIATIADTETLREAMLSIRRAAGQHTRYLESELDPLKQVVKELQRRVTELTSEVATAKTQATTLTGTFQEQFSKAQERRNTEFAADQKERHEAFVQEKTRLSEIIDDLISKLDAEHAERKERFDKDVEARLDDLASHVGTEIARVTDKANVAVVRAEDASEKVAESLERETRETVDKIGTYRSQAETLLGVIGNTGVTSGYQKTADAAHSQVRVWQIATVGSMLVLIAIAYFAFLPVVQGVFSWESFAGRVFVTLTVGVLAAYSAHQGDKYSAIERENRRLELELASIGPYLQALSPEKQEELRAAIADRTFGRHQFQSLTPSPATVVDLLKNDDFRKLLASTVKAAMDRK